jgi:hypothetical protein
MLRDALTYKDRRSSRSSRHMPKELQNHLQTTPTQTPQKKGPDQRHPQTGFYGTDFYGTLLSSQGADA